MPTARRVGRAQAVIALAIVVAVVLTVVTTVAIRGGRVNVVPGSGQASGRGPASASASAPAARPGPGPAPTAGPDRLPAAGAWRLDFAGRAGSAVPTGIFTARTGGNGWGNGELQSYTARTANAALDGHGNLVLHARRERYTGADGLTRGWTSARLDTLGHWSFRTGTLAVRMEGPDAPGTWPAFWLLGANLPTVGWPRCGEVDVVELVGRRGLAFQTAHGPDTAGRPYAAASTSSRDRRRLVDPGGWHVYSVTRAPGSITFLVDGRVIGRLTPARLAPGQQWVYDKPMFATLNLAVGGWPGPPTAATPDDARLTVDWIAYRPD